MLKILKKRFENNNQNHNFIKELNFAIWFLDESEKKKELFELDTFFSSVEGLLKNKVVNKRMVKEIWELTNSIEELKKYLQLKLKLLHEIDNEN